MNKNNCANRTIKEIIDELINLDLENIVREYIKNERRGYQIKKRDIYIATEKVIRSELYYILNKEIYDEYKSNDSEYKIIIASGDYTNKHRFLKVLFKDNIKYRSMFYVGFEIVIRAGKFSGSDWELVSITFQNAEDGEISLANLKLQIIEKERLENEEKINILLPEHIEKTKELFNTVLEKMKNKEKIDGIYELKSSIEKYNKLIG